MALSSVGKAVAFILRACTAKKVIEALSWPCARTLFALIYKQCWPAMVKHSKKGAHPSLVPRGTGIQLNVSFKVQCPMKHQGPRAKNTYLQKAPPHKKFKKAQMVRKWPLRGNPPPLSCLLVSGLHLDLVEQSPGPQPPSQPHNPGRALNSNLYSNLFPPLCMQWQPSYLNWARLLLFN